MERKPFNPPRIAIGTLIVCMFVWSICAPICVPRPLSAQEPEQGELQGWVLDASTLQPVEGVEVSIPGSDFRLVTGPDGLFGFVGVPAGTVQVRVRKEGYSAGLHQVQIEPAGATFIQLGLSEISAVLDELAVRARRARDGSAAITPSDVPGAGTVADLLAQGVPGVVVERGTGAIGGGLSIRVRGVGSITGRGEPAIFLDGVRLNPSRPPGISLRSTPGLRILEEIPAAQVTSVRVLRGPAAAAAYGESADGAILIETNVGASPNDP